MKHELRLAILGGTGKSGKYLVKQLLHRGFRFKVLLRNPENFQFNSSQIEIVRGDARDCRSVKLWMEGCQAVISTLGQPRAEPPIFSQATGNIIQAMTEYNISR